jgi:predicted enzyme related to lactoylglutathione lyase
MSVQGRVVWHDLNTTDVDASKRFYAELFAWSFKSEGQWDFIYKGSDATKHFGLVMKVPVPNVPSHWAPYLTVTNIDAALAALGPADGKVIVPKMPAGKTGHFAYVQDPQGAVFALWQYADTKPNPEVDTPPPPGEFCWDELLTSDPEAAKKFYGQVVGYKFEQVEMPGMPYTLFTREAKRPDGKPRQAAGMMKMPPMIPHPFWLSYVSVANCDESTERAKRLGATITMPPTNIPNIGRFTTMLDPTMAPIAILGPLP